MNIQCPVPKILLPVDGSEHSRRAVQFSGYLGTSLGKSITGFALLRVIAGRYLSRHMAYVDFRAEILSQSEGFQKIKEQHIEKNIKPLLDEDEKILRDLGIEVPIEKLISEGDPASEIVHRAEEGNFSTIVMARRGLSELKGFFLGSVTNKVVHAASKQSVYIVGQRILRDKTCPIPKVLIPVDGSPYSMKGAEHAACMASLMKTSMKKITILRVINLSRYMERLREGIDPEEEAREILDRVRMLFLEAGIPEGIIVTKVRVGRPSDEILKESEEEDYNLIVMGRKGRTALRDLVLGGVSSAVLERTQNPTVAIISSE